MPEELMTKIPTYDVFGYCIKCGKRMIKHEVIDGIYQIRLSGDYVTTEYLLDDGSRMRVGMCRGCKDGLDGNETKLVMDKVWRGWQHEVETYSAWTEDRKKAYLERYRKREIVTRSDDKDRDVAEKHFKEYHEKKKNKDVTNGTDH